VLSNYYQISKSASDDVRWERVEHIKLKLLIEYMLNLGRDTI
jgi:hypothetical protein